METEKILLTRIRYLLGFFTLALLVSGLTAIPLDWELSVLDGWLNGPLAHLAGMMPGLHTWISHVHYGLSSSYDRFPFLTYGTDWLAFGHIVIALAFLGPIRDPVRNIWMIELGMLACAFVIPAALIFGPMRGIPLYWRLIDCSFGVFGIISLWLARRYTVLASKLPPLEALSANSV